MVDWLIKTHYLFLLAASAAQLSRQKNTMVPFSNKILQLNSTCDNHYLNVTLQMKTPFKGVIFAKDFSQECRYLGSFRPNASLQIPTAGCGVRLDSTNTTPKEMFYIINLVIQQDRQLRQISDQEITVKCRLKEDAFTINNKVISDVIRNEIFSKKSFTDKRMGRMRDDRAREANSKLNRKLAEALSATKAWMEIKPEKLHEKADVLLVGEAAKLIFKTTLPVGIGWKVTECIAHDGLGESSQKLLDEFGCPVDVNVMPAPKLTASKPISMMRHQEAVANFAAFKFPDRDRLHLSCTLQLCKNSCRKVNCKRHFNATATFHHQKAKNVSKSEDDQTIDLLQVFNSVKVIAPEIEDQERKYSQRSSGSYSSAYHGNNVLGDKTFCVSADKMALAFVILGIIFLTAIIIVVVALVKGKRSRESIPYYTRSLFSSSISSRSGFGGSKLLFTDTPASGSGQSSSQSFSYGRVY